MTETMSTDALMYMLQVLLIIAAVLCGVAVTLACLVMCQMRNEMKKDKGL